MHSETQSTLSSTEQEAPLEESLASAEASSAPETQDAAAQGAPGEESEVAALQREHAELKDKYLRTMAEYENFRRRTQRDLQDANQRGREAVIREFLPVIDNLERAVSSAQQASDVKSVVEGVQMVLGLFNSDVAEKVGLKRIETVGSMFNPALHEAVQQQESDEHDNGTILAEVTPGYQLRDKLVRAAMVVVAKTSAPPKA